MYGCDLNIIKNTNFEIVQKNVFNLKIINMKLHPDPNSVGWDSDRPDRKQKIPEPEPIFLPEPESDFSNT